MMLPKHPRPQQSKTSITLAKRSGQQLLRKGRYQADILTHLHNQHILPMTKQRQRMNNCSQKPGQPFPVQNHHLVTQPFNRRGLWHRLQEPEYHHNDGGWRKMHYCTYRANLAVTLTSNSIEKYSTCNERDCRSLTTRVGHRSEPKISELGIAETMVSYCCL